MARHTSTDRQERRSITALLNLEQIGRMGGLTATERAALAFDVMHNWSDSMGDYCAARDDEEFTFHGQLAYLVAAESGGGMSSQRPGENAVRNVLWYFGDFEYGWKPGSFTNALLQTIARADAHNQTKLAQVFPDEVLAMRAMMQLPDGFQVLRDAIRLPEPQQLDTTNGETK